MRRIFIATDTDDGMVVNFNQDVRCIECRYWEPHTVDGFCSVLQGCTVPSWGCIEWEPKPDPVCPACKGTTVLVFEDSHDTDVTDCPACGAAAK